MPQSISNEPEPPILLISFSALTVCSYSVFDTNFWTMPKESCDWVQRRLVHTHRRLCTKAIGTHTQATVHFTAKCTGNGGKGSGRCMGSGWCTGSGGKRNLIREMGFSLFKLILLLLLLLLLLEVPFPHNLRTLLNSMASCTALCLHRVHCSPSIDQPTVCQVLLQPTQGPIWLHQLAAGCGVRYERTKMRSIVAHRDPKQLVKQQLQRRGIQQLLTTLNLIKPNLSTTADWQTTQKEQAKEKGR